MIVSGIAALGDALAPGKRLLGLDLGTRTIGLAVSDAGLRVATPLETIRRGSLRPDAAALAEITARHGVGGLVLGLPVNMDGSEGPRAQSTRQFADNLQEHADLEGPADLQGLADMPLAFWDERLSTAAVERMLVDEADMPRRRRRQVVDKAAAAWILQGALDFLSRERPQ